MTRLVLFLSVCCFLARPVSATPGPGDELGGGRSGCVPSTNAALKCSMRVGQSLRSLTNAAFKCQTSLASARYKQIVLNGHAAPDIQVCKAAAAARFDAAFAVLAESDSCAGSTALTSAAGEKQSLLSDPNDPLSLDLFASRIYCDASSSTMLDPDSTDLGFVPASKDHLRCAGKVAAQMARLAAAVRKCHTKAAQSAFDQRVFDAEACDAAALAKLERAFASVVGRGTCPSCLSTGTVRAMAVDLVTQLNDTNRNVYPCPDPVLHLESLRLDRPTLLSLGVQLLISGDDDHDATVGLRYRSVGEVEWREALPLLRVRPESVSGHPVPQQFAGSIFDLRPATSYELEIHAIDPDGGIDETRTIVGTTRSVPADPLNPRYVHVNAPVAFAAALAEAQPGDVIIVADGTYLGPFSFEASGTAENPIVIRGESEEGTILEGGGCTACNVLEIYGSFVHVEQLSLRNANRALRFQTAGAEGNVVRRVHTRNTILGFGSREDQRDFYLCDNILEGRLVWPHVYTDDEGLHSNDDGIHVEGDGHVVCHNQLVGFGDALKTEQVGARAIDFYGNEVLSAYDNGVELDVAEGNVRAFRNRFTNNFAPISFQPIYGGPAYAFRNVVINVANEQMKFHGLGDATGPSGVLAFHNTFVSPGSALSLSTTATSHHFEVVNNLFVGPADPGGARTVDWLGPIDDGRFDFNGYFPDGAFRFNLPPAGLTTFASFNALQTSGIESHGRLLAQPLFAGGLTPPADYSETVSPTDATLASTSAAIDAGTTLPNIDDGYIGTAPDLGALERGCPLPIYGVRPVGVDESNQTLGCVP